MIAYAPLERQQVIEAPVKGRLVDLGAGIVENVHIKKGELIARIQDLDENYLERLTEKLRNTEQAVVSAQTQLDAGLMVLEANHHVVDSYQSQLLAYEKVKEETIASQDAFVEMALKKLQAEKQSLVEYQASIYQLQAEFDRSKILSDAGNIPVQKFQEVEAKFKEQQAKVRKAEAYVEAAQAELRGKERDREAKIQKAQVDIEYASATLRKSRGDISKAESDVAKAKQEVNKYQKELLDMQSDVARQQTQEIVAPFDGFLTEINANFSTKILKVGDPICTIVPDTEDRAVQLWLDGNDAPLVKAGDHVRLQFEGWPALQFAGWPDVSAGTFGGEIVSIDAIDDGKGKYRILILADKHDHPWPSSSYLRQGVRSNGWVMLRTVSLWYEVWRNLNGFPPLLEEKSSNDKEKNKPPKLPK